MGLLKMSFMCELHCDFGDLLSAGTFAHIF